MEEESNIKQATPKQGLETGGLVSGSEAAKERVAKQYEKDLSGRNGPLARFEALEELVGRQIEEFSSGLTFSSGTGTQIFGANGNFVIRGGKRVRGGGGAFDQPVVRTRRRWDVVPVPETEDPTIYTIYAPKIRFGNNDVLDGLEVVNDEFELEADKWIVLEIDGATFFTDPKATVKIVDTWDGYPANHYLSGAPNYTWSKTTVPIWRLVGETDIEDGMVALGEGIWGDRYFAGIARLEYELFTSTRTRVVPIILSGQ